MFFIKIIFYTYLLRSKIKKWTYIGPTKNLCRRFKEHNSGKVKSTSPYLPFDLIYYEAYNNYTLARKREIELKKKGQQKEILMARLNIV
ncbi:endonuclease [Candidatus Falkowbacteria bacterium HGW-Falkowbacteria-1]|uniref:Endonuclease n=1 Tax=Candidatus Falkowbacteria bacterium HGW-Falkowbacteria-1 TaxID=2013768 RepID=A0A2N2EAP7_9BACT|nr:MAG: endonuclease [Candidatus Falkowbacteria bacterium HGW-Falkowbacteria-1]